MSIQGLNFNTIRPHGIGVDSNGNPVYYDPNKAQKYKKQPIFIDFAPTTTPEQREQIAKLVEAKIKQQQAIMEALKEKGKIDPRHDKVFMDPKTGELTTWKPGIYTPDFDPTKNFKPGIYDPEQREKANKAGKTLGTVLGAALALGLAFIFRGKLKTLGTKAIETLKPYLKTAMTKGQGLLNKGKEVLTKGVELAKPTLTKAKGLVNQAYTYVKNLVK